jgi:hypothetical protein
VDLTIKESALREHTSESWVWCEEQFPSGPDFDAGDHEPLAVYQEDGEVICYLDNHYRSNEEAEANARRIVACVNACKGITTENLETRGVMAVGETYTRPAFFIAEDYEG